MWYEGSGTSDKRWLIADERGSIIAVTNASGQQLAINSYDDYGIPASTNLGRFQYTGQAWLPELGLYYYKARMYSATLGRFLQTDPIGYGDGPNWYNYAHSDPVNGRDPSGTTTFVQCINDPSNFECASIHFADGAQNYPTGCDASSPVDCGQTYAVIAPPAVTGNLGAFSGPSGSYDFSGLYAISSIGKMASTSQNKHFYCGLFRNGSGVATAGGSASGSVQLPGNVRLGGSVSAGIALDGNFNVAGYVTYGGGPTTAGTGGAVGVTLGASNSARSVNDLRGFFSNISGQIGNVVGSYFSGYGASNNSVNGAEVTIGAGAGASGSAGGSNTILSKSVNLKSLVGC